MLHIIPRHFYVGWMRGILKCDNSHLPSQVYTLPHTCYPFIFFSFFFIARLFLLNAWLGLLRFTWLEVSMPNSNTYLEWKIKLYLSGAWLDVDLRNGQTQNFVSKRKWTTWSTFVNYSKLNYQHNWRDLWDHCKIKEKLWFDNEYKALIQLPKMLGK